jgi:hypothetical protein
MKRFMYLSIGVLGLSMVGFTNTRAGTITITCDDHHHLYVDGLLVGSNSGDWSSVEVWTVDLSGGPHVVAIHGMDSGCCGLGLIATIETNDGAVFVTDNTWRVSAVSAPNWNTYDFDDGSWTVAEDLGPYNTLPWIHFCDPDVYFPVFRDSGARWIWGPGLIGDGYWGHIDPDGTHGTYYFRKTFTSPVPVDGKTWGAIKALFTD